MGQNAAEQLVKYLGHLVFHCTLAVHLTIGADLGDIDGDGRVSLGDAYRLSLWVRSRAPALEPALGSMNLPAEMRFSTEDINFAQLILREALRRSSEAPLPHFFEVWPKPTHPDLPGQLPDPAVQLSLPTVKHLTGSDRVPLTLRVRTSVPLDFVAVVVRGIGVELRPEHPSTIGTAAEGKLISSTDYYLLSRGLLLYHSDHFPALPSHPIPAGEDHEFTIGVALPRGTPPGQYKVELLPATEVVTTFGEVIRPTLASGVIDVEQTVERGHDLAFPPLSFTDIEERHIGGQASFRITEAAGSPGDEVNVRVQVHTSRPINYVSFSVGFDDRALEIIDVAAVYSDPEWQLVKDEDNTILYDQGNPPNDLNGFVSLTYYPKPNQSHPYWYYYPYSLQAAPSLKYLVPLGEWVDLLQIRYKIRQSAQGRGSAPLSFASVGTSHAPVALFLPYAERDTLALEDEQQDTIHWWRYEGNSMENSKVVINGGGEPPPLPEPPIDPEVANIRFHIGESNPAVGDEVPDPIPIHANVGDIVRLPVYLQSGIPLWKIRMAFGFDPLLVELLGFEVNLQDFDGRPLPPVLLSRSGDPPGVWSYANRICSFLPNGPRCLWGFPSSARIWDERDNVPRDAILVDIEGAYRSGHDGIPGFDAGQRYRVGSVVLRALPHPTTPQADIVGRTVDWQLEWTHPGIYPIHSVTSGFPFYDDRFADRFDVPAVLVRKGVITLSSTDTFFARGDSDGDGAFTVSDAITTLGMLFLGAGALNCDDAADADDDGKVDIGDPLYFLSHLFRGGPSPPPPFPSEGTDPTEDALQCRRPLAQR